MPNTNLVKYVYTTLVLALASTVYLLVNFFTASLLTGLFFCFLVLLVENFSFLLDEDVGISQNLTLLTAIVALFGAGLAPAAGWFAGFLFSDIRKGWSLKKWLFNGAQCSLAAALASLVYLKAGGLVLAATTTGLTLAKLPGVLVALVLAATVFFLCNSTLVAVYIYFDKGTEIRHTLRRNILWTFPTFLAFTPLSLVLAQIYLWGGGLALLLFIVPLLIARQVFQTYINLKNTYLDVIKSLIAVLEAKDPYTKGHSERVAELALAIGKSFNLKPEKLNILKFAGVLHDIGKIGIPHKILRKPTRLTLYEYEQIKAHPESGALILQELKFFDSIIPIVFHHHERYDGKGYVDGLQSREIPFLARILAVADAYDAMTSPRPYRAAMTKEEACQELLVNSGTQFDPQIVNRLLELVGYEQTQQLAPGLENQLQLDDVTV